MKAIGLMMVLLMAQTGFAKVNCSSSTEKVTIDPKHKLVEIIKDGKSNKLEIVGANHHAYKMFGDSTYQLPDGYVLGLKAKRLTVFRDGSPVASLSDCTNR